MTLPVAVLVSGRGSNLQAILDACASGELDARVAIVVSNHAGVPALQRAALAGVPSAVFTLLAKLGDLEEIEEFDTWNMGIGLVVAIAADTLEAALSVVPGAVALGKVVPHSAGRRVIFG